MRTERTIPAGNLLQASGATPAMPRGFLDAGMK